MSLDTDEYLRSRAVLGNVDVVGWRAWWWWEVWHHDYWGTPLTRRASHGSWRPITTLSFRLNVALARVINVGPDATHYNHHHHHHHQEEERVVVTGDPLYPHVSQPLHHHQGNEEESVVVGGDSLYPPTSPPLHDIEANTHSLHSSYPSSLHSSNPSSLHSSYPSSSSSTTPSSFSAFSFHAVNVILHALVTAGYVGVLRGVGVGGWVCLGSGVLFAAHPVHVEAVAGVVGRAELLAALAFCLALCAYTRYLRGRVCRRWHHCGHGGF
ncbi:hypothetical protein Pmani_006378 [Petrolisthes manimaculis]|uniref:Uncharacterized protein n=1 Tax=Petrolisthes manimaculis TaxID=1843537 RepID=A0AAE1QAH7_9EUCA|nr:hypothetical protein Pmani_006378 [Petrolisthes manimaculis]